MSRHSYRKNWPGRNLGEFIRFLEVIHPEGLSIKVLAEEWNLHRQSISSMFIKDDMRLSKIEQIASIYGYGLQLNFPIWNNSYNQPPKLKKHSYPNAGNLEGLVQYITDRDYPMIKLALFSNISWNTMKNAFETGDILISRLTRINEELEILPEWNFYKKEVKPL